MKSEWDLRVTSLLRRMGLSGVPKKTLVCIAVAAAVLIGLGVWRFWPSGVQEDSGDFQIVQESVSEASTDEKVSSAPITVDVEGEVASPGMYELAEGARVGDAIEKAGGLTRKASRGSVNLAEKLTDGQLVVVASKRAEADADESVETSGKKAAAESAGGLININTASAQELQALSGIGESISQRIVEYRESNGAFKSVDDLTKVSGIGETRLASIKDKICV